MTDYDPTRPSGHRVSCDAGDPCSCERLTFFTMLDLCLDCNGAIAPGLAALGALRCHECHPAGPVARPSASG